MEKVFSKIEELGGTRRNPRSPDILSEQELTASVNALEKMYKTKLPESFVAIHKKYGALAFNNMVETNCLEDHAFLGGEKKIDIDSFYGLEQQGSNSIFNAIRTFSGRIPGTFLPVSEGMGGDLLCMDLSSANYGKLYYWLHDVIEGEEEEYFLVAENLERLIEEAEIIPEEPADPKKDKPKPDYSKMSPKLIELLKKDGYGPKGDT